MNFTAVYTALPYCFFKLVIKLKYNGDCKIVYFLKTQYNFKVWCESHFQTTSTHLSEEFNVRDRRNQFLNISHNFYDLLLSLEILYLTKRTFRKVPENESVLSVRTSNFHNPNEKCLNLAMYRYVRM